MEIGVRTRQEHDAARARVREKDRWNESEAALILSVLAAKTCDNSGTNDRAEEIIKG